MWRRRLCTIDLCSSVAATFDFDECECSEERRCAKGKHKILIDLYTFAQHPIQIDELLNECYHIRSFPPLCRFARFTIWFTTNIDSSKLYCIITITSTTFNHHPLKTTYFRFLFHTHTHTQTQIQTFFDTIHFIASHRIRAFSLCSTYFHLAACDCDLLRYGLLAPWDWMVVLC